MLSVICSKYQYNVCGAKISVTCAWGQTINNMCWGHIFVVWGKVHVPMFLFRQWRIFNPNAYFPFLCSWQIWIRCYLHSPKVWPQQNIVILKICVVGGVCFPLRIVISRWSKGYYRHKPSEYKSKRDKVNWEVLNRVATIKGCNLSNDLLQFFSKHISDMVYKNVLAL